MPYMANETNWILRVDLNGQLETFDFRYFTTTVLKPVPEPTLMTLFGTGLAAIGWRKYLATGRGSRRREGSSRARMTRPE